MNAFSVMQYKNNNIVIISGTDRLYETLEAALVPTPSKLSKEGNNLLTVL